MARILIVEDNRSFAEDLADYLREIGHGVSMAADAAAMWTELGQTQVDVILLDLGLPDECGLDVIPRLRQLYRALGVLVLTARVMLDSRILGLQLGADNYLTKPIKFPELGAHIDALCRRVGGNAGGHHTSSEWRLRTGERQLEMIGTRTVDLTENEYKLLHMLALSTCAVPRRALLAGMGIDTDEEPKKLDMLVYRLRKKVKSAVGEDLPLRNTYGTGYSLSVAMDLT